jgi:NAD(P)H-hydrate epimerase
MRYLVTAAEMRELDRRTIEEIGLPGAVLMETAGRRIAEAVAELAPRWVVVVCGGGNNGGDGFVCARVLRESGIDAAVYLAVDPDGIGGDAALHLAAYLRAGGLVRAIDTSERLAAGAASIEGADVIVDAVFGTGLSRPVEGHLARVIGTINQGSGRTVAADIPSGLDADTGAVLGIAARADVTVTMAFAKIGMVSDPGFTRVGELRVAEIGIPADLAPASGVSAAMLEACDAVAWLGKLSPDEHKGRRGHLLIVAGSPGKRGAARLAAWGGLRAGSGLVTVAGAGSPGTEIAVPDPVMSILLETGGDLSAVSGAVAGKAAIAMGPGMPTDGWGRELLAAVLEAAVEIPVVVDADGLNHLAGSPEALRDARGPVVITPHPGEAARLLGCGTTEVQRDRLAAARELAQRSGAVCVLKGARTVVCDGGSESLFATINPTGTPALATAGTGDVLTGVIGGLVAQGIEPLEAARIGVYLHGLAGEIAERDLGTRSVTASDVVDAIPGAMLALSGASRGGR